MNNPNIVSPEIASASELPSSFHDVVTFMEVPLATWSTILEKTGDLAHYQNALSSHEELWSAITSDPPTGALLDALEFINELGTESGRIHILQAAEDQQLSLGSEDDIPARELAAIIWLRSQTENPIAQILVRAKANVLEPSRTYREFVGKKDSTATKIDKSLLQSQIMQWCKENNKNEDVEIYINNRNGKISCEVLRGDSMKRVIEMRTGGKPGILNFRPAASDLIQYDPGTGRIGIATRSPQLLQAYKRILGSILENDEEFFLGENICTLKPLQEKQASLFEKNLPPAIVKVEVVELRWRRGDHDNMWVSGKNCFQILADLNARLNEGSLVEAKLSIVFSGGGRRGRVSVKVPNRIDISAGKHETAVKYLLDCTGIRGVFNDKDEQQTLWSLYPWREPERIWRQLLEGTFDYCITQKIFTTAMLGSIDHPLHPSVPRALNVTAIDTETFIGISDDPAIGQRTLTSSDYLGYELDPSALIKQIGKALLLESQHKEISEGLWFVGKRQLTAAVTISIFVALRSPSEEVDHKIQSESRGTHSILLIPNGCTHPSVTPQISLAIPNPTYDDAVSRIVQKLELEDSVPVNIWSSAEFIIDTKNGTAWFRNVPLSQLKPSTQPFTFATILAKSFGKTVSKHDINHYISPSRTDDEAAKKAKQSLVKAIKDSFTTGGRAAPDLNNVISPRPGGYILNCTACVIE